jgi:hypothetical protein
MRGLKGLLGLRPRSRRAYGYLLMAAMAVSLLAHGATLRRQSAALAVRERHLAEAMEILGKLKSNNDKREKVLAEMSRLINEDRKSRSGYVVELPTGMAGESKPVVLPDAPPVVDLPAGN